MSIINIIVLLSVLLTIVVSLITLYEKSRIKMKIFYSKVINFFRQKISKKNITIKLPEDTKKEDDCT